VSYVAPASPSIAAVGAAATGAAAVPRSAERNVALDFTKGALVLCMIVYHTLNYFRHDPALLRHIHFLPPSFIFIAGFLITHLYLPKIQAGDTRVPRRIFVRGLKTLGLFIAVNLAVHSVFSASFNRSLGLDLFFGHLDDIFLTGEQRASVFGILLPISYVLVLSAGLLVVSRFASYALPLVAVAAFITCAILAHDGSLVYNLELVSMGLLGTVAGFIARTRLDQVARRVAIFAIAYLAYSVAVFFQYPTFLMNTVGVGLALLLLYGIGLRMTRGGVFADIVTLLGNYSLLSYLVQIAVLQALFRANRYFGVLDGQVVVPLLATFVCTVLIIQAVHMIRARTRLADRTYQAVFA
jgi:hypothetical protein